MTNGTVGSLVEANGRTITIVYKGAVENGCSCQTTCRSSPNRLIARPSGAVVRRSRRNPLCFIPGFP
jgi:hypothetical protein